MVISKALILAKYPVGLPVPGQDLIVESSEIDLDAPPPEGGLLLKVNFISYDPYQRGRMRSGSPSYIGGYHLGTPIENNAISTVISSSNSSFHEGDVIIGMMPFAEYYLVHKERLEKVPEQWRLKKLENPLSLDPMIFLGALGMSGLTAYSSFYEIAKPNKGEAIFISAASGAVGQIVGQLAKRDGLKVIGSVGNAAKLNFIQKELGFDAGFNYKTERPDVALKRITEELKIQGLNIYYDNVGGEQLDAALGALLPRGRIVSCGSVSQTSLKSEEQYGIKNMGLVVGKRLTIRGFIVFDPDMGLKYTDEHQQNMQKWIKEGSLTVKMSITDGIDNAADGLVGMLKGENFGKAVLRVSGI